MSDQKGKVCNEGTNLQKNENELDNEKSLTEKKKKMPQSSQTLPTPYVLASFIKTCELVSMFLDPL